MGQIGVGNSGSAYPGALDTLLYDAGGGVSGYTNASSTLPDTNQRMDAEVLNDIIDSVLAIETTLGIDPQGAYADVVTRLDDLAAGTYTDEQAQDAIGTILVDSSTIDFTYNDATPSITGDVINSSITYAKIQNISGASKILGSSDGGSGPVQELTLGTGITITGTTINATGTGGDASTNTGTSVVDEIVLFANTGGKLLKRATGTGLVVTTSGVMSNVAAPSGTVVGTTDTQTLENKIVKPRVVTVADATSITPNADTTDVCEQTNTQSLGTLTLNAPSGTPYHRQKMEIIIKSLNAHTISFNAIYRGSDDLTLPTALSGSNKNCYILMQFDNGDTKWDVLATNFGF